MNTKSKIWIAAFLGPLLVLTILSLLIHMFRRWYPAFSGPIHLVEYAIALGVGVASIDTLTISRYQKALVLVMYIPFEIFTLFVFSSVFGCLAFGNCL